MEFFEFSVAELQSKFLSLRFGEGCSGPRTNSKGNTSMTTKKADFRTFYRDAHAVDCLTEREKMLMGLAVAMMRLCDP